MDKKQRRYKQIKRIKSKISIRRRLPLLVRVHYDVVRNWSKSKALGIGMMAVLAIFGVLLATQTVAPSSVAANHPVLQVSQLGAEVQAKVILNGPVSQYQYVFLERNEACVQSKFTKAANIDRHYAQKFTLKNNDRAGQKVCFRAKNQATSLWGYGSRVIAKLVVDPNPPVLVVRQDNHQIIARSTSGEVRYWQHVVISATRACNHGLSRLPSGTIPAVKWQSGHKLELKDNQQAGQRACFRAQKSSNKVWGFKSRIIDQAVFESSAVPTITVTQSGRQLTARAEGRSMATWQHVAILPDQQCNSQAFYFIEGLNVTNWQTGQTMDLTTNQLVGQTACFRGQAQNNLKWGYGQRTIERFADGTPLVNIQQRGAVILASSPDEDLDIRSWQYIILTGGMTCGNNYFTAGAGVQYRGQGNTHTLRSNQYAAANICFRVQKATTKRWGLGWAEISKFNNQAAPSGQDRTPVATTGSPAGTTETITGITAIADPAGGLAEAETTTGKTDDSPEATMVTDTGLLEGNQLSRLAGFLLVAGAILGTTRILLVKRRYINQG